mmetsp:Transcript_13978/g.24739  ORF Transcript_13978/g.24739 Transcript_13978/m.24739 type:complete len:95 (+) Transcript_13978:40-324(+)
MLKGSIFEIDVQGRVVGSLLFVSLLFDAGQIVGVGAVFALGYLGREAGGGRLGWTCWGVLRDAVFRVGGALQSADRLVYVVGGGIFPRVRVPVC